MSNKFENLAKEYYEQKLDSNATDNIHYSEAYSETDEDGFTYESPDGTYSERVTLDDISGDW